MSSIFSISSISMVSKNQLGKFKRPAELCTMSSMFSISGISMLSKNQLWKFKRPEELVWGPASLLRAICEHTVGDLSSVNSRHLYLLQKNLFPQLFAPRNFVLGVVKYFLVWFTRENAFCKCAQSRSVSFI